MAKHFSYKLCVYTPGRNRKGKEVPQKGEEQQKIKQGEEEQKIKHT